MKVLKNLAFILYPIGIIGLLPFLLTNEAKAGRIRKVQLTENVPITVWVYPRLPTAISFPSQVRPEKAVPGPQGVFQIDFLESNLIVTPSLRAAGSMLVYTKNARYVFLLKPGSENQYDDVVDLSFNSVGGRAVNARPLKLFQDTFRAVNIEVESKNEHRELTALINGNGLEFYGEEFGEFLEKSKKIRCKDCTIVRSKAARMACSKKFSELSCEYSPGHPFTLRILQ